MLNLKKPAGHHSYLESLAKCKRIQCKQQTAKLKQQNSAVLFCYIFLASSTICNSHSFVSILWEPTEIQEVSFLIVYLCVSFNIF